MKSIRNIAIIAHVDHGKTTLVDQLLCQSGTFATHQQLISRVMDSNDLERERGITILAKNCAVNWQGHHINIVDTPGHADFGGEVERALSMVDGVLLLIDAVEGPMPQTRFVTQKSLQAGLCPIVVVNKIDRPQARVDYAVNTTFDLFAQLGATDTQLDFTTVYCSALQGYASTDASQPGTCMQPLFQTIIDHVPDARSNAGAQLQMQISTIDYSSYSGRYGIGKIRSGAIHDGQKVRILYKGQDKTAKITQIYGFQGIEKTPVNSAQAGEIVAISGSGIEDIAIGATVCQPEYPQAMPLIHVDEPTLSMHFRINTSPFAGREGEFITSRKLKERLYKEQQSNVALRVEDTEHKDMFLISGRGELHLTILLETMRREGYELGVSKPQVITKYISGKLHEPVEQLTMDVNIEHSSTIIEHLGKRKGQLQSMEASSNTRCRMIYTIPARGLIGWHRQFVNLTRGSGIVTQVFDSYRPFGGDIPGRRSGVLVSQCDGQAVAYALDKLQPRGRLFVSPGEKVYEGMVIGIHSRENDLVVNCTRCKQLTNFRAAGKDDSMQLEPAIALTLEYACGFIEDDELVEITPQSVRVRKFWLQEHERKKHSRLSMLQSV